MRKSLAEHERPCWPTRASRGGACPDAPELTVAWDRRFESGFLQWRVCEPSVPRGGASFRPAIGCRADRQACGTSPLDDPRRAARDLDRRAFRQRADRVAPCLSPHNGGSSSGIGRRRQCHQGLARSHQLGHNEPLCRDQHQDEAGSIGGVPASFDLFGGTSPKTSLAERTKAARMARCPLIDMWPVAVTATAIRGGSDRRGADPGSGRDRTSSDRPDR
jgi:hypothetical protein